MGIRQKRAAAYSLRTSTLRRQQSAAGPNDRQSVRGTANSERDEREMATSSGGRDRNEQVQAAVGPHEPP